MVKLLTQLAEQKEEKVLLKKRVRETMNLLTNADRNTGGRTDRHKKGRHMFRLSAELFQEALEVQKLYTKKFSMCGFLPIYAGFSAKKDK